MDHPHRAVESRSGGHPLVVRRGSRLVVPAPVSDSGRRPPPVRLLGGRGRRNPPGSTRRSARVDPDRPRRRRAGRVRRRARGGRRVRQPAHPGHGRRVRRAGARAGRRPDRLVRPDLAVAAARADWRVRRRTHSNWARTRRRGPAGAPGRVASCWGTAGQLPPDRDIGPGVPRWPCWLWGPNRPCPPERLPFPVPLPYRLPEGCAGPRWLELSS
jgi:hypothetical protein